MWTVEWFDGKMPKETFNLMVKLCHAILTCRKYWGCICAGAGPIAAVVVVVVLKVVGFMKSDSFKMMSCFIVFSWHYCGSERWAACG